MYSSTLERANIMRNPYTFEEVGKILTSTNVNATAEELERTYAAIISIRNKYSQWKRKGTDPHNEVLLSFYKKFDEEKLQFSHIKTGRAFGFSPKKSPVIIAQGEEDETEERVDTKTLLARIMKRHEKELQEVIYQMAQQMVLDLMKEQYKQTEKIVTTLTQRRLKKVL